MVDRMEMIANPAAMHASANKIGNRNEILRFVVVAFSCALEKL